MEKLSLRKNSCWFFKLAIVLWGCVGAASAQEARPGVMLERPVGALALALAGATTAGGGSFCSFVNPALLTFVRTRQLAFGTGLATMGRAEGFISGEFAVSPRVGMGINLLYRGDPFLNNLHDENEDPIGSGAFTTITVKTALSCRFTREFTAGMAIGIYYQELPSGYATDGSLFYSSSMSIGGLSAGLLYEITPQHSVGLTLRELNNATNWNIPFYDYVDPTPETIDPILTAGYSGRYVLLKRPLMVSADLTAFVFTNTFALRTYKHAALSIGADWRYNELLSLRAGCGQFPLSADMVYDGAAYTDYASAMVSAGCGLELEKLVHGLTCNFAIASDKAWSGIDSQIDFVLKF